MANELDEMTGPIAEEGKDINVINKQLPVKLSGSSKFWNVFLYCLIPVGPIVWSIKKAHAEEYLLQLQQKVQQAASQIDNYMEQRVMILQNAAKLVEKGIDLDKSTFTEIAKLRAGGSDSFSEQNAAIEEVSKKLNVAFEAYPDLKAHQELADAMQQNSYTQREITAAREHYNDVVNEWNSAIYTWLAKQVVAAKRGYTTRVPFIASKETKEKARGTFF